MIRLHDYLLPSREPAPAPVGYPIGSDGAVIGATLTADRLGTYAGLIDKIPYLQELGVTAVELMPVFQADPQEGSAWGYMTLGFFALHGQYALSAEAGEQLDEFRAGALSQRPAQLGESFCLTDVGRRRGRCQRTDPTTPVLLIVC